MVQLYLGDRYIYTLDELKEFVNTMNEDGVDELLACFRDGQLIQWLLEGDEETIRMGEILEVFCCKSLGNSDILNKIAEVLHSNVVTPDYILSDYVEYLGGTILQTAQNPTYFKQSGIVNIDAETKNVEIVLRFKLLKPENDSLSLTYSLTPNLSNAISPTLLLLPLDGHKNEIRELKIRLDVVTMTSRCYHMNVSCGAENVFVLRLNNLKDTIGWEITQSNLTFIDIPGYGFINMVNIKGGTFQMGGTQEQGNDASEHERPVHSIMVKDFRLSDTLVTQGLWKAIMGENVSQFKGDLRPVTNVTYKSCLEFIKKLNDLTGKVFRLPTEEEWEYSAKGGEQRCTYKYSGSNNIDEVAWYDSNGSNVTHDVATKRPNSLGLYDMSGNVWEWCSTDYKEYGNKRTRSSDIHLKVTRGGCTTSTAKGCRTSRRYKCNQDYDSPFLGFRLAL